MNINVNSTKDSDIDTLKKLKMHNLLSLLTIAIGVLLLLYMIFVEDEPGAVPLLLIIVGILWYFVTRSRTKKHHQH